jgi:trehalose 6-phosphate synthase/phosphatase
LGVDRLDGTQGVPQKLHAIDRLLEREPKLRDNLHYIQLAAARHHAEPSELRREVNELVARINSRHGSLTGSPVQLLGRSIPIDRLIALYRAASVMLVTPLREGMSLVAQEYVGARSDGLGCLVLSEFAGASCGLVGALHVNPYDTAALASTIQRAMAMPEHEQRARMRELRHALSVSSSRGWAGAFLSALGAALRVRRGARWPGHDAHLAANLPGAALRQLRTEVDRSID